MARVRSRYMVAVVASTACSAHMVSQPGAASSSSKYAPVNEASRGGVIKYRNEGISAVRAKRRENAYKQMSDACGGRYRIDAEGPRSEGGVVTPVGASVVAETSEYWYIQFSCVPASGDSVKAAPQPPK